MPRSLASGSSPSQELRHFTNREQERYVLSRILALPSGQPLPVVMFYGVGGTGKSWLLRVSARICRRKSRRPCSTSIRSLAAHPYHTDYSRALAELRRQLASVECPRLIWPTAGCAFTRASRRSRSSRKMQKCAKCIRNLL